MDAFTKVAAFLSERGEAVLASAGASMARAHLPHYEQTGETLTMNRLRDLYALLVRCTAERHLDPIHDYAAGIAEERHAAGFELGEVQTAINVLEEATWCAVLAELPPEVQGEALGIVGTILGAAKDKLACTYVALAAEAPTRTLNLAPLFRGAREGDAASP